MQRCERIILLAWLGTPFSNRSVVCFTNMGNHCSAEGVLNFKLTLLVILSQITNSNPFLH